MADLPISALSGQHVGMRIRLQTDSGDVPREAVLGVLAGVTHEGPSTTTLHIYVFENTVELRFADSERDFVAQLSRPA